MSLVNSPHLEMVSGAAFAALCLVLPIIDAADGLALVPSVIGAAAVALQFSQRMGLVYVAVQVVLGVVLAQMGKQSLINAMLIGLLSLFAVFVSGIALRETEARQ